MGKLCLASTLKFYKPIETYLEKAIPSRKCDALVWFTVTINFYSVDPAEGSAHRGASPLFLSTFQIWSNRYLILGIYGSQCGEHRGHHICWRPQHWSKTPWFPSVRCWAAPGDVEVQLFLPIAGSCCTKAKNMWGGPYMGVPKNSWW